MLIFNIFFRWNSLESNYDITDKAIFKVLPYDGCALAFMVPVSSVSCSWTTLLPAWGADAVSKLHSIPVVITISSFSWRSTALLTPFPWLPLCLPDAFRSPASQSRSSEAPLLLSHGLSVPPYSSFCLTESTRVQLSCSVSVGYAWTVISGSLLTNTVGFVSYLALLNITFLLTKWWL